MTKNIFQLYELSNLNSLKYILQFIYSNLIANPDNIISRKELNDKVNLSKDIIRESLIMLSFFDFLVFDRKVVELTKYGKNNIRFLTKGEYFFNKEETWLLAFLYRKIPVIQSLLDFIIDKRMGIIGSFQTEDFYQSLKVKKRSWDILCTQLKQLGLINYRRNKTSAEFTRRGRLLFQIFTVERAIKRFGRDKFRDKIQIPDSFQNEISTFIKENNLYLENFYPEVFTVNSIIKWDILTGDIDLLSHESVISFRNYVDCNYQPSKNAKIALLLPCAKGKPFSTSRTHKRVHKFLNDIFQSNSSQNRCIVEEFIISEPIGVIPRKYEMVYPASSYDMTLKAWVPLDEINGDDGIGDTSKFFSSVRSNKLSSKEANNEKMVIIEKISEEVYRFFLKYADYFEFFVAYMRSTHKMMVEKAAKKANVDVIFVPNEEEMKELKKTYGPVSWALRGMRNKKTLEILSDHLLNLIIKK